MFSLIYKEPNKRKGEICGGTYYKNVPTMPTKGKIEANFLISLPFSVGTCPKILPTKLPTLLKNCLQIAVFSPEVSKVARMLHKTNLAIMELETW